MVFEFRYPLKLILNGLWPLVSEMGNLDSDVWSYWLGSKVEVTSVRSNEIGMSFEASDVKSTIEGLISSKCPCPPHIHQSKLKWSKLSLKQRW